MLREALVLSFGGLLLLGDLTLHLVHLLSFLIQLELLLHLRTSLFCCLQAKFPSRIQLQHFVDELRISLETIGNVAKPQLKRRFSDSFTASVVLQIQVI